MHLVVLASLLILFPSKSVEPSWYFFGILSLILFFECLYRSSKSSPNLLPKSFERKLFLLAISTRITYVFLSYVFFLIVNGEPFEFGAADSKGYHAEALWIVGLLKSGELHQYKEYIQRGYSDAGFPIFLSLFNAFGESIILPRLVHAYLGAQTAVISYKLASRNFGEDSGKLAGLMVAFMPTLVHYTGLHLKETLMIFFIMAFLNEGDLLVRQKTLRTKNVITTLAFGFILFFFRTLLGVAALFSLALAIILTDRRISSTSYRFKAALSIGVLGLTIIMSTFSNEISYYYQNSATNQASQMEHFATRADGNKLAKFGTVSIFAPMILIAPFPTFVSTNQMNQLMIHGYLLVKNILAFFVIYVLYRLWKQHQIKQHILILAFLLTYLAIIANSAFALSERFHLVSTPIFLIFSAEGVTRYKNIRNNQAYILYLFIVALLIIGWNWFKLAGRS